MTRKETALDALNKKIPRLEEKIQEDTKLLEELKAKKESLEFETFRQYLKENGITTQEAIAKLTASCHVVKEQKIFTEERKNVER